MENIELKNFFIQCVCGKDLRFDNTDQVRECPSCNRTNRIGLSTYNYLKNKYSKKEKNEQEAKSASALCALGII